MKALPLLLLLPALPACTERVEQTPVVQAPAAQVLGAAVSCLDTPRISDTSVRDDRTIDFRVSGGQTYRNTLAQPCPELGFEKRFAYTVSIPRLCSGEIVTVLHSDGTRGASCGLGEFVPVELARRDRP